MKCFCCGLFSSVGRVARSRQSGGLFRRREEELSSADVAVRSVHRLPFGEGAELGDPVRARGPDAQGELFRDVDV